MFSLYDQFGSSKRQSVHNTNKAIVRSHMEDCDANCKEICKKFCPLSSAIVSGSKS